MTVVLQNGAAEIVVITFPMLYIKTAVTAIR